MEESNNSSEKGFLLLGFSDRPQLERILFVIILFFYILSLLGNTAIILVSCLDPKLHMPMYFFLNHLSILDICYSSVFIHNLMEILIVEDRSISFKEWRVQFFFVYAFMIIEIFMLFMMTYDLLCLFVNP